VEIAVLDEADHMADMGFLPEVTRCSTPPARRPAAAVLGDARRRGRPRSSRYLHDPVTHEVDDEQASVTTMSTRAPLVTRTTRSQVTAEIANRDGRTIVFARTQLGADRIAGQLRERGVNGRRAARRPVAGRPQPRPRRVP
jgi:superfamily II DNA/RNA helicase